MFVFLLVYLLGCSMHMGLRRALLFCVAGYLIAWLSEYSSIHNGIPYGYYYYIDHTRGRELWVMGVPFMDSLSYVFLAYASYTMALMAASPVLFSRGRPYIPETKKIRGSLQARILGAVFFVYLDIIIDPVALLGDRWFLGQIYGYPEKGSYFGIPISNFIGWLIVGFVMIYALQKIDGYLNESSNHAGYRYSSRYLVGPALYICVLIFNLSVTFWTGEYTLGWTGISIIALPSVLLYWIMKSRFSSCNLDDAIRAHLSDFPKAVVPRR